MSFTFFFNFQQVKAVGRQIQDTRAGRVFNNYAGEDKKYKYQEKYKDNYKDRYKDKKGTRARGFQQLCRQTDVDNVFETNKVLGF